MVTGLVAVSGAISTLVISTLSGADAIGQLALNTGVAVEDLQELTFAASVSGSSVEAMEGSITRLSEKIGQAAQKGSEEFSRLGISVRDANGHVKTTDQLFLEIGNRFRQLNLSRPEQVGFAQALGIDPTLIQLLNKTSSEMLLLRKRARDFGLVSEQQQKKIIDFNDSFTILRFGMDAIRKQIAIGLSPAIKDMADKFTDFLAANKTLIIDGFVAFGNGVTAILEALNRLKFVIGGIIALFAIWQVASIGLGVVLGAIFSPVVLITGGIVALLLIIDDLIVAMTGGKSFIRDFFLEFLGFDIVPFIQEIIDAFKKLGSILVDIFKGVFALVTGDLDGFIDNIRNAFLGIVDYAKGLFSPLEGLLASTKEFFGFGPDQTLSPGQNAQTATSNSTVSQSVVIDIKTDDAVLAGQTAADSLQGQLENANVQFARGGR